MIGEKIKQIRRKQGISITRLAALAGVSKSYLSEVEKGLRTNPSLSYINKIGEVLKVDVEVLIAEKNNDRNEEKTNNEEWKQLLHIAIQSGLTKEQFQAITQIVNKAKR